MSQKPERVPQRFYCQTGGAQRTKRQGEEEEEQRRDFVSLQHGEYKEQRFVEGDSGRLEVQHQILRG